MDCQTQNNNTVPFQQYHQDYKYNPNELSDNFNELKITSSEHMLNQKTNSYPNLSSQNSFDTHKRIIEHIADLEIKQSSKVKEDRYKQGKFRNLDNIKEKEEEYFKEENNKFNSNKSLDSIVLVQEFNKLEKIYTENSLLHKIKFNSQNAVFNNFDVKNNTSLPFLNEEFNNYKLLPYSRNVSSLNTYDSSEEINKNNKKKQILIGLNDKTDKFHVKSPKFQENQDLEILNEVYFGKFQNDQKDCILKENKFFNNNLKENSIQNSTEVKSSKYDHNYSINDFSLNNSKISNIRDFFNLVSIHI